MFVFLTVASFFLLSRVGLSKENVTVTTSKGIVVGLRVDPNPITGVSYDTFLGIPYGEVPRRFQPPEPRGSWGTPLVAQSDGAMCPQPDQPFSEDCLYLNVFTPVDASHHSGHYPVMVYIHGGGFTFGSSSSLQYGPDFLVPQGVILITMNYRLGAVGFLTLGTTEAPGNLGLYDTMLALQWVQQEIPVFGGDPTRVTLFGHSAGSVLALSHYLSPVSSNLFHLAIGQSGPVSTDGRLILAKEAVRRAKLLSDAVGCDSTSLNDTMLLSCLQHVDINTLVTKQNIPLYIENLARGETLRFQLVADAAFAKDPFFPDSLDSLIREAVNRSKPLLTGFASEDGIVKFQDAEQVWKLAEDNLEYFIPSNLQELLPENSKTLITKSIRERYFPTSEDQNKILDLVRLYTDTIFAYPTIKMTRLFANFTYGYLYNYRGLWNPMPPYFSRYKVTGAFHGAELTYLFYTANSSQDVGRCSLNQPDLRMRDAMVGLWTSFAKTRSPDPSGAWGTVSTGHYLVIGENSSFINSSELEQQHYQFWADLASDNNSTANVIGNLVVIAVTMWALLSIGL